MSKYLRITIDAKDKKDVEKLFKITDEIKKQQEIIKRAQKKIEDIQKNYTISKYDLRDAESDLLIKVSDAVDILKYGNTI